MQVLVSFDLTNLKKDNSVDEVLSFTMVESGTIHGFVGVFEARLYEDIKLEMNDGWKQLFIPLMHLIVLPPVSGWPSFESCLKRSAQPGSAMPMLVIMTNIALRQKRMSSPILAGQGKSRGRQPPSGQKEKGPRTAREPLNLLKM